MANPENQAFHFTNEQKQVVISRICPNDFSADELKKFLEGAVASASHGNPIRIHIVFSDTTNTLTEKDLSQKRTPEETGNFIKIQTLHMAYSQNVFFLRRLNQTRKKNPFEKFINTELKSVDAI